MKLLSPTPPDTWERVGLRCLIIACLMFLGVEFWSAGENFYVRSFTQQTPRTIGAWCGLALFIVSLSTFKSARGLAWFGLGISIAAMLLGLAPVIVSN